MVHQLVVHLLCLLIDLNQVREQFAREEQTVVQNLLMFSQKAVSALSPNADGLFRLVGDQAG